MEIIKKTIKKGFFAMFFTFNSRKYKYSLIFVLFLISGLMFFYNVDQNKNLTNDIDMEQATQQVNVTFDTKIVMITEYVVGPELIETKNEAFKNLDDIIEKYPDWEIVGISSDQIILKRYIEDIRPEYKNESYFGLNPEGYLTLYRGNPEDNQVIETFFRIDVESLESGLPTEPVDQLHLGIPIQDLAEFNSVLSTFSEFSLD